MFSVTKAVKIFTPKQMITMNTQKRQILNNDKSQRGKKDHGKS